MIDYGMFDQRLAQRQDRWSLLIEFQREWGFTGAANDFSPESALEAAGDDDEEYVSAVPEALAQWFQLPENSFMRGSRLYWTHHEFPPLNWAEQRDGRPFGR